MYITLSIPQECVLLNEIEICQIDILIHVQQIHYYPYNPIKNLQ